MCDTAPDHRNQATNRLTDQLTNQLTSSSPPPVPVQPEQLAEEDTWYCPKCKAHVQASIIAPAGDTVVICAHLSEMKSRSVVLAGAEVGHNTSGLAVSVIPCLAVFTYEPTAMHVRLISG